MYGRATKKLTAKFILRTLDRLQMVTRYHAEVIADCLLKNKRTDTKPGFLGQYLLDVEEYILKHSGRASDDSRRRLQCDHCGKEIDLNHNGARFCSNTCRQKAYRLRLKQRASGRSVTNSQSVTYDVLYPEDET
jgi:hypothetical protein